MQRGSSGANVPGLFDNDTSVTVCCGKALPKADTRPVSILILLKALFKALAYPHDERASGPIQNWYELSERFSTGIALALSTPELGLTRYDLLLFSSFRVLQGRIDLTRKEIAADVAYLEALKENIKAHIALKNSEVPVC